MSALTAPLSDLEQERSSRPSRPALRAVPTQAMRASRAVYIAFLTIVLGVGMVGVLLLNTTIQQRQTAVDEAQRQADDLAYTQASLTSQVEQLRSTSDLATKAWAMGMRPNPNPAFVKLGANGAAATIVGTPTRVTGQEMTDQGYTTADQAAQQITKAHADAVAKKAAAQKTAAAKLAAQKAAAAKAKAAQAAAAKAKAAQAAAAQKASAGASAAAKTTTSTTGGR